MNLATLPNYPILLDLYRRYYTDKESEASSGSQHLSSHWQFYSRSFQVDIDSQGTLRSLKGEGFGSYQRRRFLGRLADYLCCAIHFLRLKHKRRIFRLTTAAWSLIKKIPFGSHYLSYDLFRQIHALATIQQYFHPGSSEPFTVLIIGDGFGFLSALTKSIYPQARLVLVDIGQTLLFQCCYLQALYPGCVHEVVGAAGRRAPTQAADFLYCPAEQLDRLEDVQYQLAANVCSMQEMNTSEVGRYFRFLRSHAEPGALFYCCNRESKILPDGEKVEFLSYPWLPTDRHLIDDHSPVYSFWFSRERGKNAPRWFGVPIPFIGGPDGPIRHRLTVLSSVAGKTAAEHRIVESGLAYGHSG